MVHKKPANIRKKGVGVSLDSDTLDRIDAVTPSDTSRSQIIGRWILEGLLHAEQSVSDANPAYRLLGGDQ